MQTQQTSSLVPRPPIYLGMRLFYEVVQVIQVDNLTFELCTLIDLQHKTERFVLLKTVPCHEPWRTSVEKLSVQQMYPRAGWVAGEGAIHYLCLPTVSIVPVCKCLTNGLSTHFELAPSVIFVSLAMYKTRVKKDAIAG